MLVLILGSCLLLAAGPKEARRAFQRGVKAERAGNYRAAFDAFSEACRQDSENIRYLTRREVARQRAAFERVSEGLRQVEQRRYREAERDFTAATDLDPSNDFARQQMEAARAAAVAGPPPPPATAPSDDPVALSPPEAALQPLPVRQVWDVRGDTRALYSELGAAYGIRFEFDDEVRPQPARLRLEEVGFREALGVVGVLTRTFAVPLDSKTALVAPDTTAKRQQYERQTLKEIDARQLTTPEAINEVAATLRTLLEMRYVAPNLAQKLITVRDTPGKVRAAERLVRSLMEPKAEVLLELQVLEVNSRVARDLGLLPPQQLRLFKLTPARIQLSTGEVIALPIVQSGNAVPLPEIFGGKFRKPLTEAQIRSSTIPISGGLPEASLGTFGHGRSLFGLIIPGLNFRAALSQSLLRSYSTLHLRAAEGQPSTFLIGSRFPIVNVSFSAIFLSGATLRQQQQGALVNPFPSFTFEDLGIKLKVTPRVHAGGDVTLALEAQTRALAGESLNGVPALSNREFQVQVRLADAGTAILAGLLAREERRSLAGLPGLADLPGLGLLFGQRSEDRTDSELLLLLTPHVIREGPSRLEASEAIPLLSHYVPFAR